MRIEHLVACACFPISAAAVAHAAVDGGEWALITAPGIALVFGAVLHLSDGREFNKRVARVGRLPPQTERETGRQTWKRGGRHTAVIWLGLLAQLLSGPTIAAVLGGLTLGVWSAAILALVRITVWERANGCVLLTEVRERSRRTSNNHKPRRYFVEKPMRSRASAT